MDVVTLPFLDAGVSVEDAIDQMQKQRRTGVVVRDQKKPRVLYAGDLLQARDNQVKNIGKVVEAEPMIVLDLDHIKKFKVDFVFPHNTSGAYMDMFHKEKVDYSLIGASLDIAMIVTDSELKTAMLSMAKAFRCTGKVTHYFPKPMVSPSDKCPRPGCRDLAGKHSSIVVV